MQYHRTDVLGNLADDPKYFPGVEGRKSRCTFRVLATERWGSGDDQSHTEGYNVVVFGNRADNCASHLNKGQNVRIEGRNRTRPYTPTGETSPRYITELHADQVQFGSKSGNAATSSNVDEVDESKIPE